MNGGSPRTPEELLRVALMHLELAQEYGMTDHWEQITADAVCMRLSAGIEALSRLDPEERAEFFGETWPLMWGMRNRIAHGYVLVSPEVVRRTVEADLPEIVHLLQTHLQD